VPSRRSGAWTEYTIECVSDVYFARGTLFAAQKPATSLRVCCWCCADATATLLHTSYPHLSSSNLQPPSERRYCSSSCLSHTPLPSYASNFTLARSPISGRRVVLWVPRLYLLRTYVPTYLRTYLLGIPQHVQSTMHAVPVHLQMK
jgi:hypothetical protein